MLSRLDHIDGYRLGGYALHILIGNKHEFFPLAREEVAHLSDRHAEHVTIGIEESAVEVEAVGARAVVRDVPVHRVEVPVPLIVHAAKADMALVILATGQRAGKAEFYRRGLSIIGVGG